MSSKQSWVSIAFWCFVIIVKAFFDYYVLVQPLAGACKLLNQVHWLSFTDKQLYLTGLGIQTAFPYPDGDRILIIARIIPTYLLVLIDSSVFYTIGVVVFGELRGLMFLKLGVIANWKEL